MRSFQGVFSKSKDGGKWPGIWRSFFDCAGRAKRRQRFSMEQLHRWPRFQSGVALRLPPQSNYFVSSPRLLQIFQVGQPLSMCRV